MVLDDLGNSSTEIERCADVTQNKSSKLHRALGLLRRIRGTRVTALPSTDLVRDKPAGEPNDVYSEQAQGVVKPRLAIGGLVFAGHNLPQWVHRGLGMCRMAALRPREAKRRASSTGPVDQRGLFCRIARSTFPGATRSAGIESIVVDGLADEDDIGNAEVSC